LYAIVLCADKQNAPVFPVGFLRHDGGMNTAEKTRWVSEQARLLGFDLCGVARAAKFSELDHLPEWLARGYAGEMKYLKDARRRDPRLALEGARSLIVVALNYNTAHPRSTETHGAESSPWKEKPPQGWISRYAWGDDYHEEMQGKLQALIAAMRAHFADSFDARAYVDTGPVIERVAAKHAGLGWLGKNTNLIHPRMGSWLFLGVIVTTLVLEPSVAPDDSPPADLCGTCTRCLDACPTKAFPEPYVLDARRCISYLTIELRGAIPEEFRAQMGNAAIGCDICQDVCPWNRKAPVTSLAAFQPREARNPLSEDPPDRDIPPPAAPENAPSTISFLLPDLALLARLTQAEFSALFRGSAVKRAKWRGLVRNACIALGNSRIAPGSAAYGSVRETLEGLASSGDPLISSHARWALARLSASQPCTACAE
jgi:epoxyqueuosine reductase